jgi:hypothetical protein
VVWAERHPANMETPTKTISRLTNNRNRTLDMKNPPSGIF